MVSTAELVLLISGKDEASKVLGTIGDNAESSAKKAGGLGDALGGVAKIAGGVALGIGITQAPGLLIDAAKAAAEDEAATLRLKQALQNLGGDYEANLEKVDDAITAGQKLAFTDDDVRDSFQFLAAATGDADEALRRQKAAMDLARGANIPLSQATKMLGKLNGENVEVFKKLGITLGENASEADALAAVQAKFGGQADAYAKSTAGQFQQASIRMGELKEQIGAALLPVMAKIGTVLVDNVIPAIERFANEAGPKVAAFADWVQTNVFPKLQAFGDFFAAEIMPKIREFAAAAQEQFQKFASYWESDIKPALDNIRAGIENVVAFIREHWPEIERIVGPVLEQIKNNIQTTVEVVMGIFDVLIKLIQGDFSGAWNALKDLIGTVWQYIGDTIGNAKDLVVGILVTLKDVALALFGEIKDGVIGATGELKEEVVGAWNNVKEAIGEVVDGIKTRVVDAFKGMVETVKGLVNGLIGAVNGVISSINSALEFSVTLPSVDTHIPGVGVVGGQTLSFDAKDIGSIPLMAQGGIVRARPGGTLVNVGEGGRDEAIIPLDERFRGGGGNTYHFYRPVQIVVQGASLDDAMRELDRVAAW